MTRAQLHRELPDLPDEDRLRHALEEFAFRLPEPHRSELGRLAVKHRRPLWREIAAALARHIEAG